MKLKIMIVLFASGLAFCAAAGKTDRPIKHTEIEGMINHIGLKYLPEYRYSGDLVSRRGDYEMMLSLHVPKEGKGPFPVVFYVHGGAYCEGSKEGEQVMAKELARRGIAFCGLNYILTPKGIFPQVWWDFHNAARFLRKNAKQYNIDPLRFGAFGISAGGWLISSASMPNGDYLLVNTSGAITTSELMKGGGQKKNIKNPDGDFALLRPIQDPAPAWPGECGGFSALSWDFCYHVNYGDAASPAIQQWTGLGAPKPKYFDILTAAGGRIVVSELTNKRFAGRGVHVPPFFGTQADVLDLDGRPGKSLGVVIADFFVRELLSPSARPPAPEIFPIPRIINAPTPVTMVAPRGSEIHYTTDGSTPTPASPVYKDAFTVVPGTTVKAVTVAPGMTPSGVYSAAFIAGAPAPMVTGPATLPPGETGKPYRVTFAADKAKVRWSIAGDLVPYVPFQQKNLVYPNGMHLDVNTGIWSGTPTKPGNYWVQLWVAEGSGMIAGFRNYRWIVTGKDLGGVTTEIPDSTDRNQDFATVTGWPADQVTDLLAAFAKVKVRVLTPDTAGDPRVMLVVHSADRSKAEVLLKEFTAKRPDLARGVEPVNP